MAAKKSNNSTATDQNNTEKQMSFEEAFAALDEIIKVLDDDKISLEDSFSNYKKGLELIKMCNDQISDIEGKLEILEAGEED